MLTAIVLSVALGQAPSAPAAAATVQDLGWIAGYWAAEGGGPVSEEVWTPPAGDNMLGMWRLVREGKGRVYELLLISQGERGPVFHLRHFTPAFVGWEEKDAPLVLPLVRHGEREAVFEGKGTDGVLRLTYRRPADDTLAVLLEHGAEKQDFRFRLRR